MNESKQEMFHDELETTIDKRVSPLSFVRQERRIWVRAANWKTDYVEFVPKGKILINLYIVLPGEANTERSYVIAQISLAKLAGRGSNTHDYPSFFYSISSVLGVIGQDLTLAEAWFAQFETPEKCLAYLRSGRDKNFLAGRPGSRAYEYCVKYLERLSCNSQAGS